MVSLDKTRLDISFLHPPKAVPSFCGIWPCFSPGLNFVFPMNEKTVKLSSLWFCLERFTELEADTKQAPVLMPGQRDQSSAFTPALGTELEESREKQKSQPPAVLLRGAEMKQWRTRKTRAQ